MTAAYNLKIKAPYYTKLTIPRYGLKLKGGGTADVSSPPVIVIPTKYMMRGYDSVTKNWCYWVALDPAAEPKVTQPVLQGLLSHVAIINTFT